MKTIKLQISEYSRWLPQYYRRQKLHYRGNPSTAYFIPAVLPQRSQGKSAVLPRYYTAVLPPSPLPCSSLVATHLRWGGIFINNFIAQFQLSASVKELW